MLPRLATAALTLAFLAAGAFGVTQAQVTSKRMTTLRTTVIVKNSQWPLPGHITVESCKRTICWDV